MKTNNIILFTLLLLFGICLQSKAQNYPKGSATQEKALTEMKQKGTLASNLDLKDFFASNPVKSFDIIHKGENAGSQYCIGTLQTKNGTYRTTIFMKQKGDLQVLQELRFENR